MLDFMSPAAGRDAITALLAEARPLAQALLPAGTPEPGLLERYAAVLGRVSATARDSSLVGLSRVSALLQYSLEGCKAEGGACDDPLRSALRRWPELVDSYLAAPSLGAAALVETLRDPRWSLGLIDDDIDELLAELRAMPGDDAVGAAASTACPDHDHGGRPGGPLDDDSAVHLEGEFEATQVLLDYVPVTAADSCIVESGADDDGEFITCDPPPASAAGDGSPDPADSAPENPAWEPRADASPLPAPRDILELIAAELPDIEATGVSLDDVPVTPTVSCMVAPGADDDAELIPCDPPPVSAAGDGSPDAADSVPEIPACEPPADASLPPAARDILEVIAAELPEIEANRVLLDDVPAAPADGYVVESGADDDAELIACDPPPASTAGDGSRDAADSVPEIPACEPRADASLPQAARDILEVIAAELPEIDATLGPLLGLTASAEVADNVIREACADAAAMIARLAVAVGSVGLAGLARYCEIVVANLEQSGAGAREQRIAQLEPWRPLAARLRAYLDAPFDLVPAAQLAALAADRRLPQPLLTAEADALAVLLAKPDFSALQDEGPERVQQATADDVLLTVPDDVPAELLDGLLQELPQLTEELSAAIARLNEGGDAGDVAVAQRIAHTLKGAGNTVGVRGLAHLTHHLEDILIVLSRHGALPAPPLAAALVNAADCLEAMTECLLGIGPAPADARHVLQEILDWANRLDRDGPPPVETGSRRGERAASAAAPQEAPELAESGPAASISVGDGDTAATAAERDATRSSTLRVPAPIIDELLRTVGETLILRSQIHDRLRRTHEHARTMEEQFENLRQLGAEVERLVDVKDLTQRDGPRAGTAFDALEMEQYNELHTYSRRLIEAALDAREMGRTVAAGLGDLDNMLTTQEALARDTMDGVLNTRLVPVASIFARLHRCVRQTSRLTGKRVELRVAGGDTMMDGDVLAQVVDPLMHLLRNAVDHGIEAPEAREAAGKAPTGRVFLEFRRDGNSILVRCTDDGSGLDYGSIRAAAERLGLLAHGEDASEHDLREFILRQRFTTRTQVSQTSGRGIGLDAVQSAVAALGGSLAVSSKHGQGCEFELRLPATLLSSHALLVRAGSQTVAITSRGIEQVLHVDDGAFRHFGSELMFQAGDRVYPAHRIDSVLGAEDGASGAADLARYRAVVLVRAAGGLAAVLVASIVASRELVVKTLGAYVPRLRGVVGATILGDGSVTPVLDVAELLRSPIRTDNQRTLSSGETDVDDTRLPVALVVDDSLSARRSLAQLLGDSGFQVETARDGVEAVQALTARRPDILFVDLEMPRMNGIELTMHVRARAATSKLPVIMVTSRSTAKHRDQAHAAGVNAYLTKPFAEDLLIERTRALLGQTA